MFDKATTWGCTPDEAHELVDFLVDQKFVNERRYTEAFVRDKLRFNKWGRVKIAYMLRLQNIDKKIVMDVFSEIDETEYQQILTGELQKKYRAISRGNTIEISGKLFRFAASRGFESEIVNEKIFEMMENEKKWWIIFEIEKKIVVSLPPKFSDLIFKKYDQ